MFFVGGPDEKKGSRTMTRTEFVKSFRAYPTAYQFVTLMFTVLDLGETTERTMRELSRLAGVSDDDVLCYETITDRAISQNLIAPTMVNRLAPDGSYVGIDAALRIG